MLSMSPLSSWLRAWCFNLALLKPPYVVHPLLNAVPMFLAQHRLSIRWNPRILWLFVWSTATPVGALGLPVNSQIHCSDCVKGRAVDQGTFMCVSVQVLTNGKKCHHNVQWSFGATNGNLVGVHCIQVHCISPLWFFFFPKRVFQRFFFFLTQFEGQSTEEVTSIQSWSPLRQTVFVILGSN